MPLSDTSTKVLRSMQDEYGAKKGKSVFYASANKKGKPAENASTWRKGQRKAAAQALAGVMCKVAEGEGQPGFWEMVQPYLPYMLAGGAGGLALGDEDTPLLQRILGGILLGGGAGYGIQNYLLPWLAQQQQGASAAGLPQDALQGAGAGGQTPSAPEAPGAPMDPSLRDLVDPKGLWTQGGQQKAQIPYPQPNIPYPMPQAKGQMPTGMTPLLRSIVDPKGMWSRPQNPQAQPRPNIPFPMPSQSAPKPAAPAAPINARMASPAMRYAGI